ncbi:hypothetical protein LWC34_56160 [Kibdelosporangium philippinense]|uniref:Uncharacterized protein n=1 Tax=Kibdelosporangium philippinense TaxID=211113 RepID=A0ABS8ZWI9_9PSEU|nr:hypothetical protein [Kibdelosporangium philippinense]MCE7012090.1 hypothetical protein [Kibdelosporangium philippinense]
MALALGPASFLAATLFAAGALNILRSGWALVGFAGMLLQNGAFTAVIALRHAMNPPTEGLWNLHEALFSLNGTFLAIVMLGLSMGGLQAGLIRRWHATLGFTGAMLMFTFATLSIGLLGLLGWLMWVVWIATYGVTLIRVRS